MEHRIYLNTKRIDELRAQISCCDEKYDQLQTQINDLEARVDFLESSTEDAEEEVNLGSTEDIKNNNSISFPLLLLPEFESKTDVQAQYDAEELVWVSFDYTLENGLIVQSTQGFGGWGAQCTNQYEVSIPAEQIKLNVCAYEDPGNNIYYISYDIKEIIGWGDNDLTYMFIIESPEEVTQETIESIFDKAFFQD